MTLRSWIRTLAQQAGYDIVKFNLQSSESTRFAKLLQDHAIDLIVDIGANTGQYGQYLRQLGYRGTILSYEPLSSAFAQLQRAATGDPRWHCEQAGVGEHEGHAVIHIAGNSQSSSLLDMMPAHTDAAPSSTYIGQEEIRLTSLDAILGTPEARNAHVFVKIDAQGYEKKILEGGRASLPSVRGIEVEMSMVPLYKDETLFTEMRAYLEQQGFALMSLEPMFFHPKTGQLLQVNGLFFRLER